MRVNVCGCEGAILLHVLQSWRVVSMSAKMPGQYTMPRALAFVDVTPWWPACSDSSTVARAADGTTMRLLSSKTKPLVVLKRSQMGL